MRLYRLCMRLCGLHMRLCKGYTDKEKRKMKTCDSHVNEEVKFVTKTIKDKRKVVRRDASGT